MAKTGLGSDSMDASIEYDANTKTLYCHGGWTLTHIHTLNNQLRHHHWPEDENIIIHGEAIERMDSAGALVLRTVFDALVAHQNHYQLKSFSSQVQSLLKIVTTERPKNHHPVESKSNSLLYEIGKQSEVKLKQVLTFLHFIGELASHIGVAVRRKKGFPWRAIITHIEQTGYNALPIIALLSCLMGVVLAYQMGLQLKPYGANIFIVDLIGISMLREFAPLLTAIIVAGRTSSSFTAQLGMMKVNEELDALTTMGMSPFRLLVAPRIIALIIALPLLTFWADLFGVLGGMFMAKGMLNISFYDFVARFERVIHFRTYLIGLSKAPVFALLISMIGCFQGFQVGGHANDIGRLTTRSVVQAIFLIIVADAIYSVIYSWQGV